MKFLGTKQVERGRAFVQWAAFLLISAVGVFFAPYIALAASSGPNSPGTLADDSTVGGVAWSNPTRAASSDNSRATAVLSDTNTGSHYLKATNFGFSIPSGATIDGIAVDIERSTGIIDTGASVSNDKTYIVKGGVIGSTNRPGSRYPTTEAYEAISGQSILWGETWTASDINSSDFGVVTSALFDPGEAELPASGQARIDHIRITVYYTEESTGGGSGGIERRYGSAVFSGYAFPQATIFIHEKGVPIVQYFIGHGEGRFEVKVEEFDERNADLVFTFVDKDGRSTPPRPVSVRLDRIQPPRIDISPPPTIGIQKAAVTRGEPVVLTGYASPRAKIDVMIDGKTVDTVTAGSDGKYSSVLNTVAKNITIGSHTASVKQRFTLTVGASGASALKQFFVSAFGMARGDFNGDGLVDIKDWSIFVAKRKDATMLTKLDLSGDGKINVVDLSIFLSLFRAGR